MSDGRGHLETEGRLAESAALDAMSTDDLLALMNGEDARVASVVGAARAAIARVVELVAEALGRGGRLIYVGAGTSGRLGVLDASECPPTFHSDPSQVIGLIAGGEAALRRAVEGAEDDERAGREAVSGVEVCEADVVLGIAAGGTTPYVWAALDAARARGARVGLLTCVRLSEGLARGWLDAVVELPVGPEVVTGSTRLKAGTATKLALNMITTGAFVRLGKVWGNLMVDLRVSNAKLRDRAVRILKEQADCTEERAAALLEAAGNRVKPALVMGRLGVDLAEAERLLEGAGGRLNELLGPPR